MRLSAAWLLLGSALSVLARPSLLALSPQERAELDSLPPAARAALANTLLVAREADRAGAPLSQREVQAVGAALLARANPSGSYDPDRVSCPTAAGANQPGGGVGFVRNASSQALGAGEASYVQRHQTQSQAAWQSWLSANNTLDIAGGVQNYTSDLSRLPRVGLALSGGGYRAMIVGAGMLSGFDSRNGTAQARGTGGLLQLASHVAGLSGGSWAVGSLALSDWNTAQTLKDQVWNLERDLVVPEDGKLAYYTDIVTDVARKRTSGWPTGITDYWGRALSYHLVNSSYPNEGQGTTFSDIRNTSSFQAASMPFPIAIADEREPGQLLIYRNGSIFEFTPYEFGSWDPEIEAMLPIDILGTNLSNGTSQERNGDCYVGYENFGWVVGTSSTLFNALYAMLITSNSGESIITDVITAIAGAVSSDQNDVSVTPNPFRNYGTREIASQTNVTLVDGGLDGQNVPLWPLLQPARQLDVIFAFDASADTTNWPNGTSLHETSLRVQNSPQFFDVAFPVIPSPATFVSRGLNTRPTFFGCDPRTNVTNAGRSQNNTVAPLIVYLASYPWSGMANTSTFKLSYTSAEAQVLLDNSVEVTTQGGQALGNVSWATCLRCATLQRSFMRSNTAVPSACQTCFQQYCYDGVTNDTISSTGVYSPAVGTPQFVSSAGELQQSPPSTGGNGSNSQQPGISSTGRTDGATSLHMLQPLSVVLLTLVGGALLL